MYTAIKHQREDVDPIKSKLIQIAEVGTAIDDLSFLVKAIFHKRASVLSP